MLGLWQLRDLTIWSFSAVFASIFAFQLLSLVPLVPVALYAILTITFPTGKTILMYVLVLGKYIISAQQVYFWRRKETPNS